ncbi:MAG: nuclear transport factor 2 family protein [Thermoleophilia bacterium]|nr:nuclear transport factor 2 family protein [Thermoleophilia bacterium]
MKSDAFRAAAESKDFDAADDLFATEVVFNSPFVFRPYQGLDALKILLGNVIEVLEDFRYIAHTETGDSATLVFEAAVGDRLLQGVDVLRFGEDGKIAEMSVMIRPMSGLQAVGEKMSERMAAAGIEPA